MNNDLNYKNYKIKEKLGRGICGIVYKITDDKNNNYALKIEK